jgi:hypothetical protein
LATIHAAYSEKICKIKKAESGPMVARKKNKVDSHGMAKGAYTIDSRRNTYNMSTLATSLHLLQLWLPKGYSHWRHNSHWGHGDRKAREKFESRQA